MNLPRAGLQKKLKLLLIVSDNYYMGEYLKLPSYKLVLVLKDCKTLLKALPDKTEVIKNTMEVIRDILITRQVIY